MNLNNMDPRLKAKLKIPFQKKENNDFIIKKLEDQKKDINYLSNIVKDSKLEIDNLKKENKDLKKQVNEILEIIQTLINLKNN